LVELGHAVTLFASGDMAGNRHIVGRVGEYHLGPLVAKQSLVGLTFGGIAADQAVAADLPDVARTADRRAGRNSNDDACRIIIVCSDREVTDQDVDFGPPKRMIFDKHSSLTDLTQRSA